MYRTIWDQIRLYLSLKEPATERSYAYAVADWCKHLGGYGWGTPNAAKAMLRATSQDALGYISKLRRRMMPDGETAADATVRVRYAALRGIYEYLVDSEVCQRNPFRAAGRAISWRQHRQKRPTKLIPFDAIPRLLRLPDRSTRWGVRDRAIIAVLFGGGLRRSELQRMRLDDIQTTPEGVPFLRIRAPKGGYELHKALPEWAWACLSELVSQRKSEGATERSPIFVFYYVDGRAGRGLSVETIYRTYRMYTAIAGVEAAPHSARATYASKMKADGHEDREVAEALGHSSTRQVQTYDKRVRGVATSPARKLKYG